MGFLIQRHVTSGKQTGTMGYLHDLKMELIRRPHPALVHFAMGVFPLSTIFLILYYNVQLFGLLQAAYWSFLFAAAFTVPIALTGLMDFSRLRQHSKKAHQLVLFHMTSGALTTLIAVISGVYFLFHSPLRYPEVMTGFVTCVVVLTLLVFVQGMVAALMIYQHKLGVEGETR